MTPTKWIIFALICVAIITGLVLTNKKENVEFTGDPAKVISDGPIADHVYGGEQQKVVLVEYGDFQCPACASMFPVVSELKEKYKDQLTFVFRNLPLTNIHPNALAAATAAEAAGLQGKFWEMHDLLYQNQSGWGQVPVEQRSTIFETYAKQLGIDIERFKKNLASADIASKIERDRQAAKKYNATSTPTMVLNGQKLPEADAVNGEALVKRVEDALKAAGYKVETTPVGEQKPQ